MARNEEKQYSKLNRMILQREKEEYEKKHPKRPRLDSLHTAEEIKQWLPSITRDIDITLKQCQVPCYTDSKVEEYQQKVLRLERQFKAFVRKMRWLQPGSEKTSLADRPYESKQVMQKEVEQDTTVGMQPIATPLLDLLPPPPEEERTLFSSCNLSLMNKPLNFNSNLSESEERSSQKNTPSSHRPRIGQVLFGLDYSSSSDSENT